MHLAPAGAAAIAVQRRHFPYWAPPARI